ncbi:TrbM/KikA/MpfK family conjugal transfer protein [Neisseriaceae bacterium ESL0693]|nr:TrbM/KikA/MpfK family conjugal transfer protein [Neisseriaceae bacterium ESL0693]
MADTDDLLTGDVKLACEATLCLSSGERPNECTPSIKRYFSISAKKMSDTIKKRKNFLELCPASNEKGMPELINAIANGAGRCDAAELNRVMRRTKIIQKCEKSGFWHNGQEQCTSVQISYIKPAKPSYCTAYEQQGWTYNVDQVRYVGDPDHGGRWINQ